MRRSAVVVLGCLSAAVIAGCTGLPAGPESTGDPFSGASARATVTSAATSASASDSASATGTGGSGSASASSSGGASPQPSPKASGPALTPPKLSTVPGYVFTTAAPGVVAALKPMASAYAGTLSAPTVRTVRRGKVTVCSIAVMRLNPVFVGKPLAEDKLVTGLVSGMGGKGYTLRNRTVSGQSVVVASKRDSTVVAWYRGGVVVLLVSTQPPDVPLAFASAMVRRT